ncbi:hypothetical protein K8B33_06930 [Alcanivorax sp. JB21]|uniref:hypothetical protein n=1 Tax=Alcanivorax limicola TaxID=2874102 RepID=UPI001CC1AC20|nr:hypothetical protein [Alcanivorax limicola]MBZ2188823.1 hypothetical protein [Alcanivorax limicola]
MRFSDSIVVALAIVLMVAGVNLFDGLTDLKFFEGERSRFIVPVYVLGNAAMGAVPGIIIGWYVTHRTLLIGACAGFVSGVIIHWMLISQLGARKDELAVLATHTSLAEGVASGIDSAIALCAFSALGMVLRQRRER